MRNFFNKAKKLAKKVSDKINEIVDWCIENYDVVIKIVIAHIVAFENGFYGRTR